MRRPSRFALAASFALIALAACGRSALDPAVMDARTLHASAIADAGARDVTMHATWFPPTVVTHPRPAPLVVVEPLFFRRELLVRPGGLVPWLESEGFSVWLVGPDAPEATDARSLAVGIARAVDSIARETGISHVSVLAASFGAPAALHALDALLAPDAKVHLDKVVLFGGALDNAYPGNVAARIAEHRGHPASSLCAMNEGTFCARSLRDPAAAAPWLGAIPLAEDAESQPAGSRYPVLARLRDLPVLFVAGKGDGLAPSESIFPVYVAWGSDAHDDRAVPKLFFLAGRENGFTDDYDAFELLAGANAPSEVWTHVGDWLRD